MKNQQHSNHEYGDLVINKAIQQVGGFNLEASKTAVNDILLALAKQARALAEADYTSMKPEIVGRTAAYGAKVADEIIRVTEFLQGRADSRPEIALQAGMLERLSDKQLEMLGVWLEAPQGGPPQDIVQ